MYARHHGDEQAVKILANERLVLERVNEFVKKHNVQCDFHYTTTFDCCMTPEFVEHEKRNFENLKQAGGDVSHVQHYTGDDAVEKTGVKGCLEAYEWAAGSSHPAKLAQWLLNAVIEKGVQLYTFAPVLQVTSHLCSDDQNGSTEQLWDVHTARGTITAEKVVYCTNGFTGHLLPQLADHIIPHRGQAHAIVPTPALSGSKVLKSTYSVRYTLSDFYSIIQRQSDGMIILGSSLRNSSLPKEVIAGARTINDTSFNEHMKKDALTHWDILFPDASLDKSAHGEGLTHAWNGIVGLTSDEVPWLGPVDGKPGQFICAGFNGHGM